MCKLCYWQIRGPVLLFLIRDKSNGCFQPLIGSFRFVADDSLLRQAINVETKRKEQACQDLQPSLTWRQVTRLLLKTIAECLKPVCHRSAGTPLGTHANGEASGSEEARPALRT
jgi:hypothetical protein